MKGSGLVCCVSCTHAEELVNLVSRGQQLVQLMPVNCRQGNLLTLLPVPSVSVKHFGELLLQNMPCKRQTLGYSDDVRPSWACLRPSSSASAAPWATKASGERARADPSNCEAAPPCRRQPGVSCPESPAAGLRHRSFTRKSCSWALRGKLPVSKLRKAAPAARAPLLGEIQRWR